jgi:purine-binding chemotaxis protein CheW
MSGAHGEVIPLPTHSQESRYLVFLLGAEDFGVDILHVKEVVAPPEITRLPFSPPHLLGVINLRGRILSIFDLRKAYGLAPSTNQAGVVVIFDTDGYCFGALVDHIQSVTILRNEQIDRKPEVTAQTPHVIGIVYHEESLITIVDIFKSLRIHINSSATKRMAG